MKTPLPSSASEFDVAAEIDQFEYSDSGLVKHATMMVTMSDGVQLATEIFVPLSIRVRGTIVERTPYGRRPVLQSSAMKDSYFRFVEHLCLNGYSVLMQDCRGTGDSEGDFVKYLNEANDGVDTIRWASQQDWWGEGAFLTGRSYSAHAALAAVVAGATDLKGIFLDCGGFWSAYHEGIRQGGAFELKQATWGFDAAKRNAREADAPITLAALENQHLSDWIRPVPWQHRQSPLRFWPEHEGALLDLWDREQFDDYWAQPSLSARGRAAEMSAFPSLHISGWYDLYTQSTVNLFSEMGARAGADAYLILGPWTHCALDEGVAGDVDFGEDATIHGATGTDYLGMRTQWFNYCSQPEEEFGPRVRFFLMGGGSGKKIRGRLDHGGAWLAADAWPPANVVDTTWSLGSKGDLLPSTEHPPEPTRIAYDYDPAAPVPTIGGSVGSYSGILAPGAFDQREDPRFFNCEPPYLPLLARGDVLSFCTDALADDVVLVGSPALDLDFSTTAADTDITVKLVDSYPPSPEYPEGFAMNICDTIIRLRCQPELSPVSDGPTTVYRTSVALPPTANRFVKGHAIRVDISSSNFPRFDVNSNHVDGGPRARHQVVATNAVLVGGPDGARLHLPALTRKDVATMTYEPDQRAGRSVFPAFGGLSVAGAGVEQD